MPNHAPTARFSSRVTAYTRARPSYPQPALDALLNAHRELHADHPEPTIADLGAGTGIASTLFAKLGCRVLAVEPNADMRAAIPPHPHISTIPASAESTTLADSSVDIALAAQAFHWFEPEPALREFHRILRPAGLVALMWNTRNPDDPPTISYYDTLLRHAEESPTSPWFRATTEPLHAARPLVECPLFAHYRILRFPNAQSLSRELLIERAMSASYVPTQGPSHAALIADLHAIFDRFSSHGVITLTYTTELHLAERSS